MNVKFKKHRWMNSGICAFILVLIITTLLSTLTVYGVIDIPSKGVIGGAKQAFAGNGGIFSDWETVSSSFKPDAKFGYRIKSTAETKYKVVGTESHARGVELAKERGQDGNHNLDSAKVAIFDLEKNTKGNVGWDATNLKVYDTVRNKYVAIDVRVRISDWTKTTGTSSDHFLYLYKQPLTSLIIVDTAEAEVKFQYFESGTNFSVPYTVSGNMTYRDIDNLQYVGYSNSASKNIFASKDSKLNYGLNNNMHVFYCPISGNDTNNKPDLAAGMTFSASTHSVIFGDDNAASKASGKGWAMFGQLQYDMAPPSDLDAPFKRVSDADEENVIDNRLSSFSDDFRYSVTQKIPAGITSVYRFEEFIFADRIDDCITVKSAKVVDENNIDKSAWFSISTVNNNVQAVANTAALASSDFYGTGYTDTSYTLVVECSLNPGKTIDDFSAVGHEHYNDSKNALVFKNTGTTYVSMPGRDQTVQNTNVVTTTLGVPDLKIEKTVPHYEWQVGDVIPYKVSVFHSTDSTTPARDVVVTDVDLPEGIDMVEDTLTVSGLATKNVKLSITNGGFELKTDKLGLDEKAEITFDALIAKKHNGSIVDNEASAIAYMMTEPIKDNVSVYINSPKLNVEKTTVEKEYGVGDTIGYEVNVNNINPGTFMRDIIVEDVVSPSGLKLKAGSIQVLDSNNNIITQNCTIQTDTDKNNITIRTHKELTNKDKGIPPKNAGVEPYAGLNPETNIKITYDVVVEDENLSGWSVYNTAVSPTRANTNGVMIKEDSDIPSGGDDDDVTTLIKGPILKIVKKSDKEDYKVGDTAKYTLTVTQMREGHVAQNVIIEDDLRTSLAAIDRDSLIVRMGKKDITEICDINWVSDYKFKISTNTNLRWNETITVNYQVKLENKSLKGTCINNIAVTGADNAEPKEDEQMIRIEQPVKKTSATTSNNPGPKTGDNIPLFTLLAIMIAIATVFIRESFKKNDELK